MKGTIVDSTLIAAAPSTKNKERQRDPEAHQSKKGSQWRSGYKTYVGVDRGSVIVHHVGVTAGNVRDVLKISLFMVAPMSRPVAKS